MSIFKQLLLGILVAAVFIFGRQVYYGQYEWLSKITDDEIHEFIERSASVKGYSTLERTLPEEANLFRAEIKRQIMLERRGTTPNTTARNLFTEIRRRNAHLLFAASDELNKGVLSYNRRWLEAVSNNAEMCERVFALGDAGVYHALIREFATKETLNNSALFEAMESAIKDPIERTPPKEDDWVAFYAILIEEGFAQQDFKLLDPDSIELPASCAATARYLSSVVASESPQADRMRAHIAKSLSEL